MATQTAKTVHLVDSDYRVLCGPWLGRPAGERVERWTAHRALTTCAACLAAAQ